MKKKGKEASERLIKLLMISIFDECFRKVLDDKQEFKTEKRIITEYEDRVEKQQQEENCGYIV